MLTPTVERPNSLAVASSGFTWLFLYMFQDAPYHPALYAGLGAKPSANMVVLCKRDTRCLVDAEGGSDWWGYAMP